MAFTTAMLAGEAFTLIRSNVPSYKAAAQNALATLQAGNVDSNYVFRMLDQLAQIVNALNAWKAVVGLDTYATSMGYPTSMATDCGSIQTAAQNSINWVVNNFPSSGGSCSTSRSMPTARARLGASRQRKRLVFNR